MEASDERGETVRATGDDKEGVTRGSGRESLVDEARGADARGR